MEHHRGLIGGDYRMPDCQASTVAAQTRGKGAGMGVPVNDAYRASAEGRGS